LQGEKGGGRLEEEGRKREERGHAWFGLFCCYYLLSVSLNIKCVVVDSKSVNLKLIKKLHSLWVLNLICPIIPPHGFFLQCFIAKISIWLKTYWTPTTTINHPILKDSLNSKNPTTNPI
jgi:hypothetical protein